MTLLKGLPIEDVAKTTWQENCAISIVERYKFQFKILNENFSEYLIDNMKVNIYSQFDALSSL